MTPVSYQQMMTVKGGKTMKHDTRWHLAPYLARMAHSGWRMACGMAGFSLLLAGCSRTATTPAALTATGFVEAEEIAIAPAVGGRVIALPVAVGQEVQAGEVLVRLDDRIPQGQVALAQAKVDEAQGRLDLARAGATTGERQAAAARLAQAQAARDGACQGWKDAQAILNNPQELDRQIAVAEARVGAAEASVRAAVALKDAAQIGKDAFERAQGELANAPNKVTLFDGDIGDLPITLPPEVIDFIRSHLLNGTYRLGDTEVVIVDNHVTVYQYIHIVIPSDAYFLSNQYWKAWVGVNSAAAVHEGAQEALALLYALRNDPQAIQSQVDQAAAQCHQAEAGVQVAQAALEGVQAGARPADLAALEALLQQAQAELAQAQLALAKQTLVAPAAGLVLERSYEVGELAVPNATLITLANLDVVQLTIYLPNASLGQVAVGQAVEVRVDNFPERVFSGEVVAIGEEAEFPPQDVPSNSERAALVFAVRVRIPNAEHLLKPGMPAEATLVSMGEP